MRFLWRAARRAGIGYSSNWIVAMFISDARLDDTLCRCRPQCHPPHWCRPECHPVDWKMKWWQKVRLRLPACLKKALMSVPAPLCFMHSVWSNNVWSQINILSPTKSAVSSAAVAIYKGLSQCLSLSFWQLGGMFFKSCRQLLQILSPPFHWVLNWVPPGFLSV